MVGMASSNIQRCIGARWCNVFHESRQNGDLETMERCRTRCKHPQIKPDAASNPRGMRDLTWWRNNRRPGGDILECGLRWAVEARRRERAKRKGNRNRKSNGDRQSKDRTRDRCEASNANKCVSATKKSSRRREWRAQTSRR